MIKLFNKLLCLSTLISGLIYIYYNKDNIFEIKINFIYLYLCVVFHFIYHFLLNIRSFYIIKKKFTKKISYLNWGLNFHSSILFQETIIQQSAMIIKSIFLRTFNIEYNKLASFFYYGLVTHVLVNIFLVLLEINLIVNMPIDLFIIQIILFFFSVLFIYFIPIVINLFFQGVKNKYINKRVKLFFYNLRRNQNYFFLDLKLSFFNLTITTVGHFFEIFVFFCIHQLLFFDSSIELIIILYGISVISDRIPIISSIPFMREFLFGFISTFFGLNFFDGFLIKTFMKMSAIFVSILNLVWINFFMLVKKTN